jgi:hypothetical protein
MQFEFCVQIGKGSEDKVNMYVKNPETSQKQN